MQNLDPSGQYSDAEVKAALSATNGHRNWSFRYSRLDKNNNFIEDIDYVQSCTINNDFLADIKRTAKFNILDTGSLNYLSDRIQPHVRLTMPPDVAYTDYLTSLQPALWWKFDDPTAAPAAYGTAAVANGTNFATAATADFVNTTVNSARSASMQLASGTLRPEYWSYINTSPTQAIQIEMRNTGTSNIVCEIYSANSPTDTVTLVRSVPLAPNQDLSYGYPFPLKGVFLVRAVPQTTNASSVTVTYFNAGRLEDSSGHGVYGFGNNLGLQSAGVVQDGGHGLLVNNAANSWGTDSQAISIANGMTVNYWVSLSTPSTDIEVYSEWGANSGVFKFYLNDDAVNGSYVHTFQYVSYDTTKYPSFSASLAIPANVVTATVPHMFTVAADPIQNTVSLYIDGKLVGALNDSGGTPISTYANVFTSETLSYNSSYSYANNIVTIDDYSIIPTPLRPVQVSTLFQKGTSPLTKRSGYVEWPQGVFLLSSPRRTMYQGNVVMREVEAYDQLLVLKEDSLDTRLSFPAGTKVTNALKAVAAKSVTPIQQVPIDGSWVLGFPASYALAEGLYGAVAPTSIASDSIQYTFVVTGGGFVDSCYNSKFVPAMIDDFYISAKITPWVNQMTAIFVTVSDTLVGPNDQIKVGYDGGYLSMYVGHSGASKTIGYDSVNHAYVNVSESNRVITFQTSPDGITWTTQLSTPSIYQPGSKINVSFDTEPPYTLSNGTYTPSYTKVNFRAHLTTAGNIVDSPLTLPTTLEWAPGTTKLQVVNDLLAAVNYESAWFDENGVFRGRPYISPVQRGAEFSYATDANSVIAGDMDQTLDLFKVPNKWILTVSEANRPMLTSTYVNSNPNSPTSTVSRGRTIVDYRNQQGAVDQTTLDAQAARLAFEGSQVYETISFGTGMMPFHSNNDVYNLKVDGLSVSNKYAESSWSMDLNPGAIMTHTVRKITQV